METEDDPNRHTTIPILTITIHIIDLDMNPETDLEIDLETGRTRTIDQVLLETKFVGIVTKQAT